MNSSFLFLIAIPLGVYLIVILFSTRDLVGAETDASETRALELPSSFEIESVAEFVSHAIDAAAVPEPLIPAREILASENVPAELAISNAVEILPASMHSELGESEQPIPENQVLDSAPLVLAEHESKPSESAPPAAERESTPHEEIQEQIPETDLSAGPLQLPAKGSPKYAFDYKGRLWIEKKRKSFFRQLRRPQIPPEEPG